MDIPWQKQYFICGLDRVTCHFQCKENRACVCSGGVLSDVKEANTI